MVRYLCYSFSLTIFFFLTSYFLSICPVSFLLAFSFIFLFSPSFLLFFDFFSLLLPLCLLWFVKRRKERDFVANVSVIFFSEWNEQKRKRPRKECDQFCFYFSFSFSLCFLLFCFFSSFFPGGMAPTTIVAKKTEQFLIGKHIDFESTGQGALKVT